MPVARSARSVSREARANECWALGEVNMGILFGFTGVLDVIRLARKAKNIPDWYRSERERAFIAG